VRSRTGNDAGGRHTPDEKREYLHLAEDDLQEREVYLEAVL
jgi:hypothetical protein